MSKAKRKPRPSPAKWYWWDSDNCYGCKIRNNCNQCKELKKHGIYERKKRDRKDKNRLKVSSSDYYKWFIIIA